MQNRVIRKTFLHRHFKLVEQIGERDVHEGTIENNAHGVLVAMRAEQNDRAVEPVIINSWHGNQEFSCQSVAIVQFHHLSSPRTVWSTDYRFCSSPEYRKHAL